MATVAADAEVAEGVAAEENDTMTEEENKKAPEPVSEKPSRDAPPPPPEALEAAGDGNLQEKPKTDKLAAILGDLRELGAQPTEKEKSTRQEELRKKQLTEKENGKAEEEQGEEEEKVTYTMKENVQAFLKLWGIIALVINGIILFAWEKAENEGGGANGNMIFYIVIGSNAFILLLVAYMCNWSTYEDDEDREPGFLDRLSFLYHCGRYSAGALSMGGTGILGLFLAIHFSSQNLGGAALVGTLSALPLILAWFCARRGLHVYGAGLADFRELDYVKHHRGSGGGHSGGGGGCGGGCGGCGGGG